MLTERGFRWVQRRPDPVPLPPVHSLVSDAHLTVQDLDGLQCIRCDFIDAHLFYAGDADVQVVSSKLGGSCRLAIAPDAEQKTHQTVAKLRALM